MPNSGADELELIKYTGDLREENLYDFRRELTNELIFLWVNWCNHRENLLTDLNCLCFYSFLHNLASNLQYVEDY